MLELFMKKILSVFSLVIFISSCASPTVVNVIGPNDNNLSCKVKLRSEKQIIMQIKHNKQKNG